MINECEAVIDMKVFVTSREHIECHPECSECHPEYSDGAFKYKILCFAQNDSIAFVYRGAAATREAIPTEYQPAVNRCCSSSFFRSLS